MTRQRRVIIKRAFWFSGASGFAFMGAVQQMTQFAIGQIGQIEKMALMVCQAHGLISCPQFAASLF
jgi:hypothetical protein